MSRDKNNNLFFKVENVRLTYIPKVSRAPGKDWSKGDVIRIQAYKGSDSEALYQGAEIALVTKDTALEIIEAICRLIRNKDV